MDEEERMDYLETARKYLAESWDNQIQNFNVKIINAKDQRTKEVFETAKDLAIIKKKEALDKFDQKIKTKTRKTSFTIDAVLVTEKEAKEVKEKAKEEQKEIEQNTSNQLLDRINDLSEKLDTIQNTTNEIKEGKMSTRQKIWWVGSIIASVIGGYLISVFSSIF